MVRPDEVLTLIDEPFGGAVKVLWGAVLATAFVLVRCAYQIDESRDGSTGELIRDEVLFMVMEAMCSLSPLIQLFEGCWGC